MNDKICPACGSDSIEKNQKEQIIREPFGGQKTVLVNEYSCKICGSTGDFFNENEASIQDSLSVLKSDAIANILEDFSQNKISLSSMERALELPQRTLTKWKNKASNPSSTGIALLKFLRIFPWLLDVAENKYDYTLAQQIHMTAAFKEMLRHMSFNENIFPGTETGAVAGSVFIVGWIDRPMTDVTSEGEMYQESTTPQIEVSF